MATSATSATISEPKKDSSLLLDNNTALLRGGTHTEHNTMHTRKEYMSGDCTHQEFYEQMVTDKIKEGVRKSIGLPNIMKSTCEHFNDIPLSFWDTLGWNLAVRLTLKSRQHLTTHPLPVGCAW